MKIVTMKQLVYSSCTSCQNTFCFCFFGLVTLLNINAENTNKTSFIFSLLLKILTTVK